MLVDHPELIPEYYEEWEEYFEHCPNFYMPFLSCCKECVYAVICKCECYHEYPELYKEDDNDTY